MTRVYYLQLKARKASQRFKKFTVGFYTSCAFSIKMSDK